MRSQPTGPKEITDNPKSPPVATMKDVLPNDPAITGDRRYQTVSVQNAQQNQEYWRLVEAMFREQAARLIQRRWRAKHKKEYKGKNPETLNGPLSSHFLKEPIDKKAEEHVQHIQTGQWLALDFQENEFVRNIFKAARLGLISVSQMATAFHLREALVEFREEDDIRKNIIPLKQHVFTKNNTNDFSNPKEPFKFFNISYATKENSIDFQERLKKLPDNERSYFSINLSKRREIAFLYDGLASSVFYKKNKNFNTILQHYLKRQPSENVMPVIGLLSDLDSSDKEKSASAAKMLREFILRQEPNQQDFLEHKLYDKNSIKDRDSSIFLINLLATKEQLPNIALSPKNYI